MSFDTRVVIPFKAGCLYRERSLEYVKYWWEERVDDVVVSEIEQGRPWSKGLAVHQALEDGFMGTIVVADADSIVPGAGDALRAVYKGADWAMPHTMVHRLDEKHSELFIEGVRTADDLSRVGYDQEPYVGVEGGGCVVLSGEAYRRAPMDPEFEGWGQQDKAWALVLRTLYGAPYRSTQPLIHLWHPHPERVSRLVGSQENARLLRRYRGAALRARRGDWSLLEKRLEKVGSTLQVLLED